MDAKVTYQTGCNCNVKTSFNIHQKIPTVNYLTGASELIYILKLYKFVGIPPSAIVLVRGIRLVVPESNI